MIMFLKFISLKWYFMLQPTSMFLDGRKPFASHNKNIQGTKT
jgi:hypothetical protein